MHDNNRRWFEECRAAYPSHFTDARVLEIGSMDPECTIRRIFHDAVEYVGVDRGPINPSDEFHEAFLGSGATLKDWGVDITCAATETIFAPNYFDTLVSASLLEHDPDWRKTISHNLSWLRPGGIALISFGAEGNTFHYPEPWAFVPHIEYLDFVQGLGLAVVDSFFEEERYQNKNIPGGFASVLQKKP